MAFNLYKNGYFLHCVLGALIYEYCRDFGMGTAIIIATVIAVGVEIIDLIRKKNDINESTRDFLSTEAGVILAIFAELLKSYLL